jgi:V8-like Glu-specific endopeptidase
MNLLQTTLLAGLLIISSLAIAKEKNVDVVYGDDNRIDVFQSPNEMYRSLARSTVAMISADNFRKLPDGQMEIFSPSLRGRGICPEERFINQPTAASCSGFLVAPNVIVTAGHCIRSEYDCVANRWVFDYKTFYPDQDIVRVPMENIYSCKKIITSVLDNFNKDDYAVIELDRKVTDRVPLEFRKRGKVSEGSNLVVIGHPAGLPTKVADGASVRSLDEKFFVANLDTYGGNSGSAVFNADTGKIEGILVRGENDYTKDYERRCLKSVRCTNDSCRGEDVTYITNVKVLKSLLSKKAE